VEGPGPLVKMPYEPLTEARLFRLGGHVRGHVLSSCWLTVPGMEAVTQFGPACIAATTITSCDRVSYCFKSTSIFEFVPR